LPALAHADDGDADCRCDPRQALAHRESSSYNEAPVEAATTKRAMTTPAIDALATGGASLVALAILLSLVATPIHGQARGTLFALGIALNWPHFIASYRMLYSSRDSVLRYRAASLYFPAALALYTLLAIVTYKTQPIHYHLIVL